MHMRKIETSTCFSEAAAETSEEEIPQVGFYNSKIEPHEEN